MYNSYKYSIKKSDLVSTENFLYHIFLKLFIWAWLQDSNSRIMCVVTDKLYF